MEKEFNSTMLNLKELCTYYSKRGYRLPINYGTELTDIPIDLLKKVVFINCDEERLKDCLETYKDPVQYIEDKLLDEYVVYAPDGKGLVEIAHYKNDLHQFDRFNIWAMFAYIYLMDGRSTKEKNTFLYVTILFPYIYQLNKYGPLNRNKIEKILADYPIKSRGAFNLTDVKNWMNKSDEEIRSIIREEQSFLIRFNRSVDQEKYISEVIESYRDGISVIRNVYNKGRKR